MARAILDTNVLIHAAYSQAQHHAAAAVLVDRGLRTSEQFCIAPQNLIEFAAVVSREKFVGRTMPPRELARMTELLYRSRRLSKIYPRRGTVIRAIRLGTELGISGPAWYDLFLAATALDAGVEMIVTDNARDFHRFPFITTLSIEEAVRRYIPF